MFSFFSKALTKAVPLYWLLALILLCASAFVWLFFHWQAAPAQQFDWSSFVFPAAAPELMESGAFSNDFLQELRAKFLEEKTAFLEADLSSMKLRFYDQGQVVGEVKIAAKGKKGSWWETPAGLYKIEGKERNHFSSIGEVYMPYSLQFQGNFFIHGWPYYPSGAEVASDYSGGCIRLATEDAKAIFALAKIGMPLLVWEDGLKLDATSYQIRRPNLEVASYLVADLESNFIFLQKEADSPRPIASLTKLLTVLVSSEYMNLDNQIRIRDDMLAMTTRPRLEPGQKWRVADLYYPLLLESSNEAAYALARGYSAGLEAFIKNMNAKAVSLGMLQTVLVDPAGLEPENVSTAKDLFSLARHLYFNKSFVLNLTKGDWQNFSYQPVMKDLGNFNDFYTDQEFVGGKIGYTNQAKKTFLGVFELQFEKEKRPVAIILLGSDDLRSDVEKLLLYVRDFYALNR